MRIYDALETTDERPLMTRKIQSQLDVINQRLKELNAVYREAASKSGISDGELCVWSMLLASEELLSQQDLLEALSLPRQTVNSIISKMSKKGHVTLEHLPGTRNKKVIVVTEEGRRFAEENVSWVQEAERRAILGADAGQVDAFIDLITDYLTSLKGELGML